jgi:hypothetical protein
MQTKKLIQKTSLILTISLLLGFTSGIKTKLITGEVDLENVNSLNFIGKHNGQLIASSSYYNFNPNNYKLSVTRQIIPIEDLNTLSPIHLPEEMDTMTMNQVYMFMAKDKIYLGGTHFLEKKSIVTSYVQEFDLAKRKLIHEPQAIFQFEREDIGKEEYDRYQAYQRISDDDSKILYYRHRFVNGRATSITDLRVYNSDMELLYTNDSIDHILSHGFISKWIKLLNNGNVVLYGTSASMKKPGEWEKDEKYKLVLVNWQDGKTYEKDFEGEYDKKYGINEDGDVIITGYSTQKDKKASLGIFYRRFDGNNLELLAEGQSTFPKDFIIQGKPNADKYLKYANKYEKKNGKFPYFGLSTSKIIMDKNGNTLLIGSENKVATNRKDISYTGDLVLSYISKEGEVLWNKKITRRNEKGSYNIIDISDLFNIIVAAAPTMFVLDSNLHILMKENKEMYAYPHDTIALATNRSSSNHLVQYIVSLQDGNIQKDRITGSTKSKHLNLGSAYFDKEKRTLYTQLTISKKVGVAKIIFEEE